MGYIQKNLMDGEKVMYEARLHSIVYVKPILCVLAAIVVALIPSEDVSWPWRALLVAIVALLAFIWAVSIHGGKMYVVTTRRLIFKRGIVKRTSFELLLRKCEGIHIEQSVMGRLLNYGSVIVTTGEASNRYDYIRNPLAFSSCINQQIDNLKIEA